MTAKYLKDGEGFKFPTEFGFRGSAEGRHDAKRQPVIDDQEYGDGSYISRQKRAKGGDVGAEIHPKEDMKVHGRNAKSERYAKPEDRDENVLGTEKENFKSDPDSYNEYRAAAEGGRAHYDVGGNVVPPPGAPGAGWQGRFQGAPMQRPPMPMPQQGAMPQGAMPQRPMPPMGRPMPQGMSPQAMPQGMSQQGMMQRPGGMPPGMPQRPGMPPMGAPQGGMPQGMPLARAKGGRMCRADGGASEPEKKDDPIYDEMMRQDQGSRDHQIPNPEKSSPADGRLHRADGGPAGQEPTISMPLSTAQTMAQNLVQAGKAAGQRAQYGMTGGLANTARFGAQGNQIPPSHIALPPQPNDISRLGQQNTGLGSGAPGKPVAMAKGGHAKKRY